MRQNRLPLDLFKVAVDVSRRPVIRKEGIRKILCYSNAALIADGEARSLPYVTDVVNYVALRIRERRINRTRLKAAWASRRGIGASLPWGCPARRLIMRRLIRASPLLRMIDAAERARSRG